MSISKSVLQSLVVAAVAGLCGTGLAVPAVAAPQTAKPKVEKAAKGYECPKCHMAMTGKAAADASMKCPHCKVKLAVAKPGDHAHAGKHTGATKGKHSPEMMGKQMGAMMGKHMGAMNGMAPMGSPSKHKTAAGFSCPHCSMKMVAADAKKAQMECPHCKVKLAPVKK